MKTQKATCESKNTSRAVANNVEKEGLTNFPSFGLQAKLSIEQANDKYEQETDAVANQVMRISARDFL